MKKRILCFCLCLYCIGLWAANASFKKTGNDLLFLLPQGNVKLEFCTDDMFRVRHSQGTVFAENEQWMVRKYDFTPVHYTVEDKGAAWLITTGKLIIEATKNPFCLSVSDKTANCFIRNLRNNVFIRILSRRKLFYNRMSISLVLGNVWISWISEGVRSI